MLISSTAATPASSQASKALSTSSLTRTRGQSATPAPICLVSSLVDTKSSILDVTNASRMTDMLIPFGLLGSVPVLTLRHLCGGAAVVLRGQDHVPVAGPDF